MSHGHIPRTPSPPLLLIHPGPVARMYIDGCEVGSVSLTQSAALAIAAQLLSAVSVRLPATPTENLPFAAHIQRRRDDGVTIHADEDDQA